MVSIATAGDLLQWHPHGHILLTDGAFSDDGAFHPLATWDGDVVMKLFRERLLARLRERHAISEDLVRKLLAWRHPGFSAPLSLKKLVYLDGQKAVLYRSRMNPSLGRNFEAMDPLEWLARMADHIPDELGEAHQQGLPRRPAPLPPVRGEAEDHRVRQRRDLTETHPRRAGPEPA